MRLKNIVILLCLSLTLLVSCNRRDEEVDSLTSNLTEETEDENIIIINDSDNINNTGMIYLYGEIHGKEVILNKEFELWKQYYDEAGMRHLFIEASYPKAQLLNLWMIEEKNVLLDDLITTDYNPEAIKEFYRRIKEECPETIFHGFDIGKGFTSHGINYRNYLKENGLVDSEMYEQNEAAIQQEKYYRNTKDDLYREEMIVENLIREFDQLKDKDIMGIIGSTHIKLETFIRESQTIESMGMQLTRIYEDRLQIVNLENELLKALIDEPLKIDQMEVAGKLYTAEYFGKNEYTNSNVIIAYEFWQLVDAYEDFKNAEMTGELITALNYPMKIEENQVYVVIALLKDNTTMRYYALSDGEIQNDLLVTKMFILNN